ncbi:hypothetical protein AMD27_06875 [Acinetobacter sp. TGL-Y2]|uniref:hypothetical protein n=1 Tax=Acinetobacter sp. TGL-Y2 TaxID=1407071 RepID=UPI0007A67865|nr:hypothetical protein [Acinetobacter sp. TGL-Y2]AMW78633.1 hypothetical protein AMD27_06875 [Acinetobacter sp. TGL-Y2]
MSSGIKFTKREWIHLIITLSIVQGVIWFASFIYADNSSALGYVSFAGTIISIILAVLAIGYTYGESQQQKNSSHTLAQQLNSLDTISDKLAIQAEALEDMKIVKDSMVNISNQIELHFRENHQKIDFLSNNISILNNNISPQSTKNTTSTSDNFYQNAKHFNNPLNYLNFVIIALFFEKEFTKATHHTFDELVLTFDELQIDYAALQVSRDYLFGSSVVLINNLLFMNSINYDAKYINQELIDLLKFSAQQLSIQNVDIFNKEKFSIIANIVLKSTILNVSN